MNLNIVDKELVKIRQHLHAHPELSEREFQTADMVVEFVARYNPTKVIERVGGTGVLVIFDFAQKGPTVLFRAELDALPIQEINEFDHRSTVDNVAHKCGHDGHATILIGLAKRLSDQPFANGKIVLLFQPAEENGAGAKAVLNDPKFLVVQPDYVFAFHNLPGYPLHQVVIKYGSFTAAVKSIAIKIQGKTAHAAEPEHGANPAMAIAALLSCTNSLSNNQPEREDFAVITPIHIEMGSSNYGISAGHGVLRLTMRTWTEEQLDLLTQNVLRVIQSVTQAENLETDIEWIQHFVANQNNTKAVDIISQAAYNNQISITTRLYPFKWGEDFGLFTQYYKGAMFGIGSGEHTPALHNPDYDFPDAIIPTGVNLFYEIATNILRKDS
ncbi:MAG: amidohydrolase [Saprospiraceae bacterium]|jgi:amidohydrolase